MLDYVAGVKEKVKTEINSDVETQYLETAIFAAGVFWGVEYLFQDVEGVVATKVGYIGGQKENPTYKEVSNRRTKHAEAVKVIYDIRVTSYKKLCKYFFEIHDPTQKGRQGPEIGNHFRSEIFYVAIAQKEIAEKLKERLKNKGLHITTEITRANSFWPAEDYHQKWHTKKETKPHWHKYTKRFD
ncbi:MAG TPA: peptide-methionine (S)-S-oxide reductase [Flavobacteriaceae bacterium]|nr:peptide-methionine (S)-S-oxide reductase [Flavobacteriaceae bacterium]